MADDSDLEKTEQPSARRLEQAREEGQVPQSRELSTFLVLLAGVAGLWVMGGWMSGRILGMLREGFHIERVKLVDQNKMLEGVLGLFMDTLVTMTPLFAILLVSAIAAPILMGGFVFSPNVLSFKFERMDPMQGFARMFSMHGVAELVKSLMKTGIVGVVGAYAVWREREHIFTLMGEAIESAVPDFLHTVLMSALLIIMGLAILALIDVPFQLWQYNKRLRMTKEEVKREAKEQEGDPHVKARIRGMQREMARRRMMAQVPKADVVVTNPTHFSVALKYDAQKMRAPIVVAKGRGELALKIRELAKENKVPLLEAPPLARALYKHCDLEQAVPGALYTAVAEVMAYVYQLNHWLAKGGLPPAVPAKLPVPEDMDPGSPD